MLTMKPTAEHSTESIKELILGPGELAKGEATITTGSVRRARQPRRCIVKEYKSFQGNHQIFETTLEDDENWKITAGAAPRTYMAG